MKFSTRTRYGLRFLLRLAAQPDNSLLQLGQVAQEESISPGYLEQIVRALKPLGILRAVRGSGGGYALSKPPSEINMEDVFLHLDTSATSCATRPCKTSSNQKDPVARIRENIMWNYTNAVHEHFLRPHNAGPMEDANAIGEVGSLACGDALKLYLKINDEGIIEKASFETFGCASAIASSSVLTDMVKGMKAEDALKLTNKEIAEALGGLPKEKMHCSVMGQEALEAAIRQWKGETPVPHAHEEGRLVCKCFGITDAQIIRAIRENGLKTVEEITNYTKAGGACGDCQDQIAEILAAELKQKPLTELRPVSKPRMTNVQRMQLVMKTIEEEIRPQLAADGGDIELVDVDGKRVVVSLRGRCAQCRSSEVTIRNLVERVLREHVEADIVVEEA